MTDHARQDRLKALLLSLVPADGASVGNQSLSDRFIAAAKDEGLKATEKDYDHAKEALVADGVLARGRGRGGSVHRVEATNGADDDFDLSAPEIPEGADQPKAKGGKAKPQAPKARPGAETQVLSYRHLDKRKNNPEVGVVTPATDGVAEPRRYKYDPHIDPALAFDVGRGAVERLIDDALVSGDEKIMLEALAELKRMSQPYLNWAGKAERTSFEIETVSLHVHERIDPPTILAAVRKELKSGKSKSIMSGQGDMFSAPFENLPLRDAIDFYKHERGWSNRLIAGDSLLVMNSLLQKESMAGQVQMIYIDPPYGIKYGSNFQPFVGKKDVKDKKDEDLTQEPEMIKAFRDTWELGIHSYLTYLRDRIFLARDLLGESGSIFVQISSENIHKVRQLLDEVFGPDNHVETIAYRTKNMTLGGQHLEGVFDYLVWYAKNKDEMKFRRIYSRANVVGDSHWNYYIDDSCVVRKMTSEQVADHDLLPGGADPIQLSSLYPAGVFETGLYDFEFQGRTYVPPPGRCWKSPRVGMERLAKAGRLVPYSGGSTVRYALRLSDYPVSPLHNIWADTAPPADKVYVVQTGEKVVQRCMHMCTDPGDLVLDLTCGSGTTAYVAEKLGRRWITCDTSRVAVALAKQRLMTSSFDYYELRYPQEGVRGGFLYETVPHLTLKSITNNPGIDAVYEKFHPLVESAVSELNLALSEVGVGSFLIGEGGRKGKSVDLSKGDVLLEWEIPVDYPPGWPEKVMPTFFKVRDAMRLLQSRIDEFLEQHSDREVLYDQPAISREKLRIAGPFTVEAVPFPSVLALDEAEQPKEADVAIARSGESSRQHQWKDELFRAGIRGKGGQKMSFSELEILAGTRYLHASGLLKDTGERVVVSFGPPHAPLEQRQVELALREAETLRPSPKFIVFAAFSFDPEAAKDIDQVNWPGVTMLKAQMNTDLLTEDLKKARSSNESFWLMGQPEVEVRKLKNGEYQVEVKGFDYFDTAKGELVSGGKNKIAMWLLDTDYDERSLLPRQVFFPMAGDKDGWQKLKKDIKAELNEDLLHKYHGTISLPFEAGDNRKVAVKVVDDRGIESLKIIALD